MYIVLSGRTSNWVDRVSCKRSALEWQVGDMTAMLLYWPMVIAPGDTVTDEPTDFLIIRSEEFAEMNHNATEAPRSASTS